MEFIDLKSQQARIKAKIDQRIQDVLSHGRYVMGPELDELEERLKNYVGTRHCIGASSGTDTLLIAMMALGIGPGDEVITVPFTWISTAEMIALIGATPVFVDIDETTWNMEAIMPLGIFGQTADMIGINEIASRNGNLPVIEDAAQSFGATHHGKKSGGLSTIGSTSFFPSKPLGCYGDGGGLFTNDDELAERMRHIRVHGQTERHHHPILGINGRLDTLQAAILLEKLEIFDDEILRRQEVAQAYGDGIRNSSVTLPMVGPSNTSVFAQYTILSSNRDVLAASLKKAGIPSVSYYAVPLHLQPVFADLGYKKGQFPITEDVASRGLSLPMNPYLSEEEVAAVCDVIVAVGA